MSQHGPMTNRFASLSSANYADGAPDYNAANYALALARAEQLRRERGEAITRGAAQTELDGIRDRFGTQSYDYGTRTNRNDPVNPDTPFEYPGSGPYSGWDASPATRMMHGVYHPTTMRGSADAAGQNDNEIARARQRDYNRALKAGRAIYSDGPRPELTANAPLANKLRNRQPGTTGRTTWGG